MDEIKNSILDYPLYSKVELPDDSAGIVQIRLFDKAGKDEVTNMDSPSQFSTTDRYEMMLFSSILMKTDGSAIAEADRELLSKLIRFGWLTFRISQKNLFTISLSMLHTMPAAGTPANSLDLTLRGTKSFRVPLRFLNGQNFECYLNYRASVDLSALTYEGVITGLLGLAEAN